MITHPTKFDSLFINNDNHIFLFSRDCGWSRLLTRSRPLTHVAYKHKIKLNYNFTVHTKATATVSVFTLVQFTAIHISALVALPAIFYAESHFAEAVPIIVPENL